MKRCFMNVTLLPEDGTGGMEESGVATVSREAEGRLTGPGDLFTVRRRRTSYSPARIAMHVYVRGCQRSRAPLEVISKPSVTVGDQLSLKRSR